MPPRPRTVKTTEPDASVVDQMADDAAPEKVDYPLGAPEFKVLLAIRPRGRRAEFKRLLAEVAERSPGMREQQEALAEIKDSGQREAAGMRLWAEMDEVYERVEGALRLAAVDVEKFDAWVAEASDETLQQTWQAYQQRTQPGEAQSSTS